MADDIGDFSVAAGTTQNTFVSQYTTWLKSVFNDANVKAYLADHNITYGANFSVEIYQNSTDKIPTVSAADITYTGEGTLTDAMLQSIFSEIFGDGGDGNVKDMVPIVTGKATQDRYIVNTVNYDAIKADEPAPVILVEEYTWNLSETDSSDPNTTAAAHDDVRPEDGETLNLFDYATLQNGKAGTSLSITELKVYDADGNQVDPSTLSWLTIDQDSGDVGVNQNDASLDTLTIKDILSYSIVYTVDDGEGNAAARENTVALNIQGTGDLHHVSLTPAAQAITGPSQTMTFTFGAAPDDAYNFSAGTIDITAKGDFNRYHGKGGLQRG
jgi:hypothetical protein